jgi:NADPH2:quinone reductase
MKAIVIEHWTEPGEVSVKDFPLPIATANGVVIDVRAAGCNFFDGLLVQGKYQERPPFPFVPGAECAGVVREVGTDVVGVAVGDRVMAGLVHGAFAEQIAVPAARLMRIPKDVSFEDAAAFPVVFETAYGALVLRAALRAGETLLVTAAAGGVGLASVQLGKALGARVIGVAGGEEKLRVVREAGADVAIDYTDPDWAARVLAATEGRGADVIVESVGGTTFHAAMKCVAWSGRLVTVGFVGGTIPELAINRLLLKNATVMGLFVGTYLKHDPARLRAGDEDLVRRYEKREIRPFVFRTFPLAETGAALAALAGRKTWGKVVVVP